MPTKEDRERFYLKGLCGSCGSRPMHEGILDCLVCRDARRERQRRLWRTDPVYRAKLQARRRLHQQRNADKYGTTHRP